ncbi:dna polymerase subunit cdc27 protein [Stemphylium lycopersici]|nr:dna polymerase subunit cdc27 protein [Stemphylium lycopersici]
MLFEFHKKQNARKPNSIHATYLLTGTPRRAEHTNGVKSRSGQDTDMRSSPFMSSMPEPDEGEDFEYRSESDDEDTPAPRGVKETRVLLVREEDLEETRAEFEEGASAHIYSLEPGPLEIFGVLSLCNHEVVTEYADEDPLERWKTYGSIRNQYIKVQVPQTAKYAPPPAATASKTSEKPASKPTEKPAAKSTVKSEAKENETAAVPARRGSASEDNTPGRSTPQPTAGSSTLKRSDSKSGAKKDKATSDLFKSFAKAKPKAKEAETSKESTPAPVEDEPMQGMSEDEGDPDDEPEVKIDEEKNEAARKAREERAERLRKMMEDDDEEMPDAPAVIESQPENTPAVAADTPEPTEGEATVTVTDGRRRGRRRVMKKKKVKDEDGYLVTKEEAVWESFSEDEPAPKKPKPAPAKPTSSAKGKAAGKKGQGSIASFFKKA